MTTRRAASARHLPRWLPVALVAGAILVASVVRTGEGHPTTGPFGVGLDKYLHAAGYGVLAGTVALALRRTSTLGAVVLVVGATVGYGVAIELCQWPLSYRTLSLLDVVADGVGAVVAVGVWWVTTTANITGRSSG